MVSCHYWGVFSIFSKRIKFKLAIVGIFLIVIFESVVYEFRLIAYFFKKLRILVPYLCSNEFYFRGGSL